MKEKIKNMIMMKMNIKKIKAKNLENLKNHWNHKRAGAQNNAEILRLILRMRFRIYIKEYHS